MPSITESDAWVKPSVVDEQQKYVIYDFGTSQLKMPIVIGCPDRDGCSYVIVCPYCGKKHFHSRIEGTRIAHCGRIYGREYYLRPYDATGPYWGWGES